MFENLKTDFQPTEQEGLFSFHMCFTLDLKRLSKTEIFLPSWTGLAKLNWRSVLPRLFRLSFDICALKFSIIVHSGVGLGASSALLLCARTFVRLESLGDIGCHKSSRRIVKQLSK